MKKSVLPNFTCSPALNWVLRRCSPVTSPTSPSFTRTHQAPQAFATVGGWSPYLVTLLGWGSSSSRTSGAGRDSPTLATLHYYPPTGGAPTLGNRPGNLDTQLARDTPSHLDQSPPTSQDDQTWRQMWLNWRVTSTSASHLGRPVPGAELQRLWAPPPWEWRAANEGGSEGERGQWDEPGAGRGARGWGGWRRWQPEVWLRAVYDSTSAAGWP